MNKKLKTINSFIKGKNNVIVDVGCDHCYSSILALSTKKAKFAYNIDDKKEPLTSGINNIKNAGFIKKTSNILSSGLETDKISQKINYCIISGLGSSSIFKILKNKNKDIKIEHFLIMSNDNPIKVRQYFNINNITIEHEEVFLIDNIYYFFILTNNKKPKTYKKNEIYFGEKKFFKKNQIDF
jgi:tRNA (adenine22-N1)-methyltransferase